MERERNLLAAALAVLVDLIGPDDLGPACAAWRRQPDRPMAELLERLGKVDGDGRAELERLLARRLSRHDGDAARALDALADNRIRRILADHRDEPGRDILSTAPDHAHHPTLAAGNEPRGTPPRRPGRPDDADRYELIRLHARGGIGRIWVARDAAFGREVARKELRPEKSDSASARRRLVEEARITGQLQHPGIVPVYEMGTDPVDGAPFYTMRLVRGRTLSEAARDYHRARLAAEDRRLDLLGLLDAFVAVCNAVAYAHARGVIHRDLKGANVLLGDFGEVVLLDWGLAKLVDQPGDDSPPTPVALDDLSIREPTLHGRVLGTPAYMPPEQARGLLHLVDRRSDVFGLGAILYEILAGRPPFAAGDTETQLRLAAESNPEPPRVACPSLPRALEAICLRALAAEPADRYHSAAELAREVRRFLAGEPVEALRERWPARLARRWHGPATARAAGVLLVVAVVLALSALAMARRRDRERLELAVCAVQDALDSDDDRGGPALPTLRALRQLSPQDAEVRRAAGLAALRHAETLVEEGEADAARVALDECIDLLDAPGLAPLRLARALNDRATLVDDGPAAADLNRVLSLLNSTAGHDHAGDRERARALARFAAVFEHRGDPAAAADRYGRALTLTPPDRHADRARLLLDRARALRAAGENPEAALADAAAEIDHLADAALLRRELESLRTELPSIEHPSPDSPQTAPGGHL